MTSINVVPAGAVAQTLDSGILPSGFANKLLLVGEVFISEQLVRATSDFSDINLIIHGNLVLYSGAFDGGIQMVAKRINLETVQKNWHDVELEFFCKASHERIVSFLGHCLDNENEKFLAYKYTPHGELSNALYMWSWMEEEGLRSLDWITRLEIAIEVA